MEIDIQLVYSIAEIIGIIATIALTLLAVRLSILFHKNTNTDSITTKTISCLTGLLPEYRETMGIINEAYAESQELEKYLLKCLEEHIFTDFNKEYYSDKYENFRRVHYFFEMLGSLMNQHEIRKETFWHFFSFPIDYFIKTRNVRMMISDQKCLPSYAENFCWLFVYYNEYRKKFNKKWILNGESKDVFNDYDASFLIFRNYKEYKEQCEKLFRKR